MSMSWIYISPKKKIPVGWAHRYRVVILVHGTTLVFFLAFLQLVRRFGFGRSRSRGLRRGSLWLVGGIKIVIIVNIHGG